MRMARIVHHGNSPRAIPNTRSSIGRVNLPVFVFWRLGW
jgi:hypothetical protein